MDLNRGLKETGTEGQQGFIVTLHVSWLGKPRDSVYEPQGLGLKDVSIQLLCPNAQISRGYRKLVSLLVTHLGVGDNQFVVPRFPLKDQP